MRKRIIPLLVAFMVAMGAWAQSPFFNECENNKNVTTVFITKAMLQMASELPGVNGGQMKMLRDKIDNVQIVTSENSSGRKFMEKRIGQFSSSNGYELLMKVNDDGEDVKICRTTLNDDKFRYVAVVKEDKEMSVIIVEGKLSISDMVASFGLKTDSAASRSAKRIE